MSVKAMTGVARQQAAAAATRLQIVRGAHSLFIQRGYAATTIPEIARISRVAVQTVYNSIGPKRAVLAVVLEYVAAGPEHPTPVPAFMHRRVSATRSGTGAVRVLAAWFADVHGRLGLMLSVLRDAAAFDPEVATLERARDARRFRNYHEAAGLLAHRGQLRAGLAIPEAAATIWGLGHAELYRFLVLEQAWTPARYRRWLDGQLRAQLLEP